MLRLLKSIFGRSSLKPLVVEAYWCEASIKLPSKVKTPLGGSVTVITACVDIQYIVEEDRITVQRVHLSRGGGGIMGSNSSVNVAASRRGEAWYATSICSESMLLDAVQRDLEVDGSRLRRIMMGKWRDSNRGSLVRSLADALNEGSESTTIASLISTAGRSNDIAFTYTKPDGTSTVRHVSVQGVSGSSLRARDQKDGEVKSFRLDRISKARPL